MKQYSAIAIIEFRDIATGIYATDSMIKKAPIALFKCGIISQGRYLTLIGGNTASVDDSYSEGLFMGGESVIDQVFLPDVHPQVHDAVLGQRNKGHSGAMAIVETPTVSCNVRAAELALKGTAVVLSEIRLADSWLNGKCFSLYRGELHDVQAAVDIAVSFLEQSGKPVNHRIIPSPHEALGGQLDSSSFFIDSSQTNLDGEAD